MFNSWSSLLLHGIKMPAHVQLRFIDIIMSSVPLHGVTFPYLSDKNPLSTPLNKSNLKTFLFPKLETCHVFRSVLLSSSPRLKFSVFAARFKL